MQVILDVSTKNATLTVTQEEAGVLKAWLGRAWADPRAAVAVLSRLLRLKEVIAPDVKCVLHTEGWALQLDLQKESVSKD